MGCLDVTAWSESVMDVLLYRIYRVKIDPHKGEAVCGSRPRIPFPLDLHSTVPCSLLHPSSDPVHYILSFSHVPTVDKGQS